MSLEKRVGMWAGTEMARNEGDKQTGGGGEGRVERKMEGRGGRLVRDLILPLSLSLREVEQHVGN